MKVKHLTAKKCKMCGAPLHGYKCEYCGTEYEENEEERVRIYANGVCVMEIECEEAESEYLLNRGMITPNEVRKARGLPPIDEMEMKHFDR